MMSGGTDSLPAIIRFGAGNVRDYPVRDFEATLRRFFAGHPDRMYVLDSKGIAQRFIAATAAWAIGEELLYIDRVARDDQREFCVLRLTDAGRSRYCGEGVSAGAAR
jgi:hypothetical protein